MRDNDLRHAAVSSSDNPVLADQRSSTEVESSAVLVLGKCTFMKRELLHLIEEADDEEKLQQDFYLLPEVKPAKARSQTLRSVRSQSCCSHSHWA